MGLEKSSPFFLRARASAHTCTHTCTHLCIKRDRKRNWQILKIGFDICKTHPISIRHKPLK